MASGTQLFNWNDKHLQEQVLNHQLLDHPDQFGVPTGQSTNTWAHLMPQGGIPDQIHPSHLKLGEGGVVTVGPIDSVTSGQQIQSDGPNAMLLS